MFEAAHMNVLAYANGFTLWHYLSADGASDIEAPAYFPRDSVGRGGTLRPGDIIMTSPSTGHTIGVPRFPAPSGAPRPLVNDDAPSASGAAVVHHVAAITPQGVTIARLLGGA